MGRGQAAPAGGGHQEQAGRGQGVVGGDGSGRGLDSPPSDCRGSPAGLPAPAAVYCVWAVPAFSSSPSTPRYPGRLCGLPALLSLSLPGAHSSFLVRH